MKLTAEHIDRLYQFTRQHYVEWFDLQTELVDHLANAIEQQCKENPKVSFEEALQMEFKKFGVFGFMEVVEQRQVSLNKRYNKIIWQHFKGFFSIPKIIFTSLLLVLIFFIFSKYSQEGETIFFFFFLLLTTFWIGLFYQSRRNKKQLKSTGKKWLLKEIIFGHSSLAGLSYIPIQFLLQVNFSDSLGIIKAVFLSLFFVSLGLFEYIILVEVPSKAEDYLKETYPEYVLENAN